MKIKSFSFFILTLLAFSTSLLAQSPQQFADGKLKVDGKKTDWGSTKALYDDLGAGVIDKKLIDVQKLYMGYDSENLYIYTTFSEDPTSKSNVQIFSMSFDSDATGSTGNSEKYNVYEKAPISGFNHRVDIAVANSKLEVKLFSSASNLGKFLNNVSTFTLSGNVLEMSIPLVDLDIDAEKDSKVRIFFAEFANSTAKSGYSKKSFSFSKKMSVEEAAEADAKEAATTDSAKSNGSSTGFYILLLMLGTVWGVSILCAFAIAPKAGLSSGTAAISLIPFAGTIIFLFILAFGKWPLHKDYSKLEAQNRELESYVHELENPPEVDHYADY